jgi:hypothetical protein
MNSTGTRAANATTDPRPPVEMTTPALVREYAERKVATSLAAERAYRGVTTADEAVALVRQSHDRHVAVCDELRRRGVLD